MWARIHATNVSRYKDALYVLYSKSNFKDITVDEETDPELFKFVESTKKLGPKFGNYSPTKLKEFLDKIYELRKDNSNNSA